MKTPRNPMRHCIFRIPAADLERARKTARTHGIPLAELIRLRLRDLPVPDRAGQRERFEALRVIGWEMQQIGNNINQAIAAIHRANLRNLPAQHALSRFNSLLESYLQSRDRLLSAIHEFLSQ